MFFKSRTDFLNQTLTCLWKCFIGELENCFKLQNKTSFNNIYEIWTGHNREMSRLMTKPTKWLCAQRRLRSAWAFAQSDQSSLCAQWVAKDPRFLHADSENSDQTGWMPRLIWVFAGRRCHFVGFVMRRLKFDQRATAIKLPILFWCETWRIDL